MKQSDAEKRWCPFIQWGSVNDTTNRPYELERNGRALYWALYCVGDKCMAWRYDFSYADPDGNPLPGADGTEVYCGLAGEPE